jgi:hypothetical protein
VSKVRCPAISLLLPHLPCSSPSAGVHERSTPVLNTAPRKHVSIMAGPGRALSARTAVRGGAWRQFHCVVCDTYFLETHGALFYGKPRPDERLVRVVTALAEGLGLRAATRVFAVDPNTVLTWLREAADQLAVFSCSFLRDVKVNHVQLDELFAVLSAGKTGQGSDIETSVPCSRAPHWVGRPSTR